tara:strand:+ start:98 stop:298 length:201 start_codon:yes stop_codon:yes gene_type:complete
MIGTNYTNKLPKVISEAMKQVSSDDCYLIKRRVKGVTGTGVEHITKTYYHTNLRNSERNMAIMYEG